MSPPKYFEFCQCNAKLVRQKAKKIPIKGADLHGRVEKLEKMLEACQSELPSSAKDRLAGLHQYVVHFFLLWRT